MELRVLRYFLTAVDEGNITRAADILHITQPTLSRQLIELEKELGTTLLIRGKRSLTLTDDGMLFKQQAEEIVELADKAERTFIGKKDTVSGVIALGATESVGSRVLSKYICKFIEKYPKVQFDLYSETADSIKDKIEKGLLDLGLLLEPVDNNKYEFLRLSQKETWGVLLRKDHPLAEKETIYVEDLKSYRLFLPKREGARNEVLNWIGCEESHLNVSVNYNLLSNVAILVDEGLGCAVCLDGALSIHYSPDILFKPVFPEHTTRSVLLWKKNHLFQPAASLFIQMINTQKWEN
ncbi:MAG TPA: LysR family transcriptional regulator [Candidatus Pelethocola excrementipullorum]|nr:LysR family transcriptional regulator [Candidatus Pelethocola excrementipullorum]